MKVGPYGPATETNQAGAQQERRSQQDNAGRFGCGGRGDGHRAGTRARSEAIGGGDAIVQLDAGGKYPTDDVEIASDVIGK